MRQLLPQYHRSFHIGELLALRAYFTRDVDEIRAAVAAVQGHSSWTSNYLLTELLLADLGAPLPPTGQAEEWLIPFEQVRANWLGIAQRLVQRAALLA